MFALSRRSLYIKHAVRTHGKSAILAFRYMHVTPLHHHHDYKKSLGGPRDIILSSLRKLDLIMQSPGTANVDLILDSLKTLHEMEVSIPISFFFDAANIMCTRNDSVRVEILIHLFKDNVDINRNDNIHFVRGDDPVVKLVSFAISGLFRHGATEQGSQLWVRMTNSGFKTNRAGMDKMLDRMVGNIQYAPSLEFISSIHTAMKAHLWHQSPGYYGRILKAMRQHFMKCGDSDQLKKALSKLDYLWSDMLECFEVQDPSLAHLVEIPIDLYALRVHCHAAAMRTIRLGKIAASDPVVDSCRTGSLKSFSDLLSQSETNRQNSTKLTGSDLTVKEVVEEVKIILASYEHGTSKSGHMDTVSVSVDNKAMTTYYSLNRAQGDTRRAVSLLLTELAGQGRASEATDLLEQYIGSFVGDTSSDNILKNHIEGGFSGNLLRTSVEPRERENSALTSMLAALSSRSASSFEFRHSTDMDSSVTSKAAAHYPVSERIWQGTLACEIMRSTTVSLSAVLETQHRPESSAVIRENLERKLFQSLEEVFLSLKRVLLCYQIKPGAAYYASFIDALRLNMQHLASQPSSLSSPIVSWPAAREMAERILLTASEKVRSSNEVVQALVGLLCQPSNNSKVDALGVLEALQLVQEHSHSVSSTVLCTLLQGATDSLDDTGLLLVLNTLEGTLAHTLPNRELFKARVLAHCRLRDGYQAMHLLRAWRRAGGTVEPRVYRWIVHTLHQAPASSRADADLATNPKATVDYIMQEMARDGHRVNSEILALLLRLYTKAVQINSDVESHSTLFAQMDGLIKRCVSQESLAVVNESVLRELVKSRCIAGSPTAAMDLITQVGQQYSVQATAASYEPIIFYHAVLCGDLNAAEDVLMGLVSRAVPLSDAVVASFVDGLMRHGELSEALDCIQDMYNQHGVRPPVSVWTTLLDASLRAHDEMEGRRVVHVIRQLYSEAERERLIGPAQAEKLLSGPVPVDKATSDSESFMDRLEKVSSRNIEKGRRSDAELCRRQEAIAAYWSPHSAVEAKFGQQDNESPQPEPGYLLKLGVPMGQSERGVLSDAALEARFSLFGLRLN